MTFGHAVIAWNFLLIFIFAISLVTEKKQKDMADDGTILFEVNWPFGKRSLTLHVDMNIPGGMKLIHPFECTTQLT